MSSSSSVSLRRGVAWCRTHLCGQGGQGPKQRSHIEEAAKQKGELPAASRGEARDCELPERPRLRRRPHHAPACRALMFSPRARRSVCTCRRSTRAAPTGPARARQALPPRRRRRRGQWRALAAAGRAGWRTAHSARLAACATLPGASLAASAAAALAAAVSAASASAAAATPLAMRASSRSAWPARGGGAARAGQPAAASAGTTLSLSLSWQETAGGAALQPLCVGAWWAWVTAALEMGAPCRPERRSAPVRWEAPSSHQKGRRGEA
eukprot:6178554-Pleurochrysis_carterae.AAC.1